MDFDITPSSLFAGLVFGAFGWYFFKEGRRNAHLTWVGIGLTMMVYPYFVSGPLAMWGIGVGLMAIGYKTR